MIRRRVLFCCFMLMTVYSAWSEDIDDATLKAILKKSDTTVIIYFISFFTLPRMAVSEEKMRESYDCKLLIKDDCIVNEMSELIFAARKVAQKEELEEGEEYYEDVRLLVDVISDDAIIYSVGTSFRFKIGRQILNTVQSHLGLKPLLETGFKRIFNIGNC